MSLLQCSECKQNCRIYQHNNHEILQLMVSLAVVFCNEFAVPKTNLVMSGKLLIEMGRSD